LLPQLGMWPIGSANLLEKAKEPFLASVKHHDPMIPTSRNGWAGVLNGVVIPFQDPLLM